MATIQTSDSVRPKVADKPLDQRTRISSISAITSITLPFVGMLVYCEDTKKIYKVTALNTDKSAISSYVEIQSQALTAGTGIQILNDGTINATGKAEVDPTSISSASVGHTPSSESGMSSTNVKDALDELGEKIKDVDMDADSVTYDSSASSHTEGSVGAELAELEEGVDSINNTLDGVSISISSGNTGYYITNTNTLTAFANGVYTDEIRIPNGITNLHYLGKYGAAAIGIIFLDSNGGIINYTSKTNYNNITEEDVAVPEGAAKFRACSLDASNFSVNSNVVIGLKDRVETNETNISSIENEIADVPSIKSALDETKVKNYIATITDTELTTGGTTTTEDNLFFNQLSNEACTLEKVIVNSGAVDNAYLYIAHIETDGDTSTYYLDKKISIGTLVAGTNTISDLQVSMKANSLIGVTCSKYVAKAYSSVNGIIKFSNGTSATEGSVLNKFQNMSYTTLVQVYAYTENYNIMSQNSLATNIYNVFGVSTIAPNYLYGKKIVAIGDSMVQGHTLSDASGQTWLAKLATRNGMTRVNYGINGTYLSNHDYGDNHGVIIRYTDMDDDADYVIVFAGTNDSAQGITLGEITSTDNTEFYGALNLLCEGLQTKYPTKKIGFITPYLRTEGTKAYVDAIVAVCAKYSIPVFNNVLNGGICWSTNGTAGSALRLNDTYHLNELGMEYASYKYEAWLRTL